MLGAGFLNGSRETVSHHYYKLRDKDFFRRNEQFFNPKVSWVNKYKQGNPELGLRPWQPFSTWTSDYYHVSRVEYGMYLVGFVWNIGEKKKFKDYVIDAAFYSSSWLVGFHLGYK